MQQGRISFPGGSSFGGASSAQAFSAAVFAALTSGCGCKACRLLRKAAASFGDELLEEVDGRQDRHQDPLGNNPHGEPGPG